ncbi:hypothetical protein BGI30_06450 [Snodgrassella alvi]|jgi:hypothetical protein|nr:hypothetical protein BGI30_06450 [Snodgrassella alvi]PIT59073.1 hypothetical protein BHC59_00950 [Snodgrassella alvi]
MKRLILNLEKKISVMIICFFIGIVHATEIENVESINRSNICKENNKITRIFTSKNLKYLNGNYYGAFLKNKYNYSVKLNFDNNFLNYVEIQDNALHVGIRDNSRKIILHISCQDIYNDISFCHRNKILFDNTKQLKNLKKICSSNVISKNIPKTSYLPDIFVEYLYINGVNIQFLKDLFEYQKIITNGIVDTF